MSSKSKVHNLNILKKNIFLPFASCFPNQNGKSNFIQNSKQTDKLNQINIIKSKSKIGKYSLSTQKKKNNYFSFISSKSSTSFFLDHTFAAARNVVLSKLQENNMLLLNNNENRTLKKYKKENKKTDINIKYYLRDLNKTFDLNIDVLTKMYCKDKNINNIIERIKIKLKEKENIRKKIEKIKGAMIIEKQIQGEHRRKIAENDITFKEQISISLDKLTIKEEYIIALMKKLKELEIFSKRKSAIPGSGYEKHKDFRIADFIDLSNKFYMQKNILFSEISQLRNNILEIKTENNSFNSKDNNINDINHSNKDINFLNNLKNSNSKKYINYYNNTCRGLNLKIKLLKTILNKINSKNLFLIKILPKLKDVEESYNYEDEKSRNNNDNKKSFIQNVSNCTSIDITNLNNDLTKRLESFIDLSIILNDNKNNEITSIIDTVQGNIILKKANFSNVLKIK